MFSKFVKNRENNVVTVLWENLAVYLYLRMCALIAVLRFASELVSLKISRKQGTLFFIAVEMYLDRPLWPSLFVFLQKVL